MKLNMQARNSARRTPAELAVLLIAAVLALGACDPDGEGILVGGNGGGNAEFDAQLDAMNTSVGNLGANGNAEFEINEGVFVARVSASGLAANTQHPQHIHADGECPPASADDNGDGFIDVIEGLPFYGSILIPLDGDLRSQSARGNGFPGAPNGTIAYEDSANVDLLLADLRDDAVAPGPGVVKLGPDEELDLGSRTVVLHGVDPATELPASVQSLPGLAPTTTLPVACGEID